MTRPDFLRCEKPALPSVNGCLTPVDELPDPHRGREGAVLHHVFDCPGRDVQALAEGGFVEQLGKLLSVAWWRWSNVGAVVRCACMGHKAYL